MRGANLSVARANTIGLGVAAVLAVATALAQVINYEFFDLRLRALDANTHMSIFGGVSLLANAVAVALAISLAVRTRNREIIILSGVLAAMFALRVTYPPHVLLLSLPLTGIALVLGAGLVFAGLDELRQLFVPGRGASPLDSLLDLVALAVTLALLQRSARGSEPQTGQRLAGEDGQEEVHR